MLPRISPAMLVVNRSLRMQQRQFLVVSSPSTTPRLVSRRSMMTMSARRIVVAADENYNTSGGVESNYHDHESLGVSSSPSASQHRRCIAEEDVSVHSSSNLLVPKLNFEHKWSADKSSSSSLGVIDDSDDDHETKDKGKNPSPPSSTPPASSASSASSAIPASLENLRPSQVVSELDRHIVGQYDAKRAVAIAMRNRWRRRQLANPDLRKEISPRNVLLVGPTGCGKTEVARRMAQLNEAPFLKVEATKFTEVGYHGRDVDQIVRDLMDVSMQLTRKIWTDRLREQAREKVEDCILDLLTGPAASSSHSTKTSSSSSSSSSSKESSSSSSSSSTRGRESFREMLRQGILDDQEVEVDVPVGGSDRNSDLGGLTTGDGSTPNIVAMSDLWQRMAAGQGGNSPGGKKQPTERKKLPISQAREVILEAELDKLLETVDLKKEAITAVEESGIVFIDEIDKICSSRDSFSSRSADASAEGVQRDLLPLIEGTTINTKYGNVSTEYVLFVASGAFHAVKPSDLLPELQGRLPIRVELKGLSEDDLYRILTEPVANLVRQQVELIATEGVTLEFEDAAIREMARMAAELNRTVENIGARRLHTVMERIMEPFSFQAAESEPGTVLTVTAALVQERLADVTQKKTDLAKYIL